MFVGGEHFAPVGILITCAFGHEDCVVVALAEDKRGENHVDYVELNVANGHYPQNPQPAHSHGNERRYGQFDAAKRQPQEEEHYAAARPAYVVEVVGQVVGYGAVHVCHVECVRAALGERLLHARHVLLVNVEPANHIVGAVGLVVCYA